MSPTVGGNTGGTRVTIFGQGFDDPVAVSLGTVGQTVVSTAGSEIVFITSGTTAQCPTSGDLPAGSVRVVNIDTGLDAVGPTFSYRFARPLITGVSPNNGPAGGGNVVSVNGSGFEAPLRVTLDDVVASVGASNATSISITVPAFTGTFGTRACTVAGAPGTQFVPEVVDLQVTNLGNGCVGNSVGAYTYNPPDTTCRPTGSAPVANFTFTAPSGSNNFTFADSSTNAPTSWSWNFGDPASGASNTSNQQNPLHTFAGAPQTYTVTLQACNAVGCGTVQKFVQAPAP
jgi:hypothetical protein